MVEIGNIYVMKVYFKEESGDFKDRPVLVFNQDETGLYTVVEITSVPPKNPPGFYDGFKEEIKKWQKCGLDQPSYVKCKNTHRVEEEKLYKLIGTMSVDDFNNIIDKLTEYN